MLKRPLLIAACLWTLGGAAALQLAYVGIPLMFTVLALAVGAGLWLLEMPGRQPLSLVLLLFISFSYIQWYDERNASFLSEEWKDAEVQLSGQIVTPVIVDGDRASFSVRVRDISATSSPTGGMSSDLLNRTWDINEEMQISLRLMQPSEQEEASEWGRGDSIELAGTLFQPSEARNFGGFDYRKYLRYQHIHWQVSAKGTDSAVVEGSTRWDVARLLSWNDQFRARLAGVLDELFSDKQAGYMKGMLIGVREDLDPEQFQQFSQLGLTHILAISGLHVAVFVGAILTVLGWMGLTRETKLMTAMILLPFYIIVTGSAPSVIRAGIMAIMALYAARKNTLKDGLNLVSLVGLLMLIWNPYYLVNVSFQLSFLVTIGLIVGVSRMNALLPNRFPALTGALSVTLVAQAASFPLSIYYFNQFSLLSWIANFIIVPMVSLAIIPAGFAALVIGSIWIPAGRWPAWAVTQLNELSFRLVDWMDGWNWFHLIWPSPSVWWIVAYYALLAAIVWEANRRMQSKQTAKGPMLTVERKLPVPKRERRIYVLVPALFLLLVYGYNPDFWKKEGVIQFLDVGQGDSILIRTPEQLNILIDGGGTIRFQKPGEEWKQRSRPYEVGSKLVVPLLKQRGVHRLDWMVITHADTDHIGGLQAVIEQIPVDRLMFNGRLKDNEGTRKLFRTALDKNISLYAVEAGQTIPLDRHTSLRLLYPHPTKEGEVIYSAEQNENSVVFLLDMFQAKVLFTGDLEKLGEFDILHSLKERELGVGSYMETEGTGYANDNDFRPIDVLKVGHHGSKTSTTEEWLHYWQPRHAVISAGVNNRYGHPSPVVVERLENNEVNVLRTDLNGEIQMIVSKHGYRFRQMLP
ncbi:DNA internalization-related competence protein ComEC/Rec2 [Paenibacillus sp. J2TS4]|uniref:DNA internalization-related competence protein ComEC/Rec2 n=1 Tax=Paenibacillus sp. J2TS4 TaxID=2807194 RepID=UPI001B1E2A4C|nr:DNA internalization-related competence protein ComEC/Rec2 [Paenibacillus sp. J2TS4]GIP35878.1 ComE operon protein 3 [Paenibacillus sp. J2TS4]